MVDRDKDAFTYPLHKHEEMELNFVEHCDGARRIVGDSIEVLGKYDLVLVGSGLEHAWDQYDCQSHSIHEITIQFAPDLLGEQFLQKNQLSSLRVLFENAKRGIAFELPAIMDRSISSYRVFRWYDAGKPQLAAAGGAGHEEAGDHPRQHREGKGLQAC